MTIENKGPLDGLVIIDASTMIAAPWASTYLADFGATVIKIEHPIKGDHVRNFGGKKEGIPLFWKTLNRNKKTITLDLGKSEGQKIFKRLVEKADVVIENFRPGVFDKWNLSWEELSVVNPSLVMLSASGYGQDGPYSKRGGFGTIAEAMSGFASINGEKGGAPILPGIPLADGVTSVFSALAVMIALYERNGNHLKEGQHIDISIYEPLMRFLEPHMMNYNHLGILAERMGSGSMTSAPRNTYQTKEGDWVALSGAAQVVTERIFKTIGREDLILNDKFKDNKSRLNNSKELDEIIGGWIKQKSKEEVIDAFHENGAVIGPVYDIKQIFEDEHFKYRESFITLEDDDLGEVKIPNVFAKFSKTPGEVKYTGAKKGENNNEIFKDFLKITDEEFKSLSDNDII